MFASSLSTYSFYSDDAEAASIRDALAREGLAEKILGTSPLSAARRIQAVRTIHHGHPLGDPVALPEQLALAERLGQRGLVDAYMYGGARSGFLKLSRLYICGGWVAAALAIAEQPTVADEEDEVRRAIQWVRDARARGDAWEILNQPTKEVVASIRRLNISTGANFRFPLRIRV